MRGLDGGIGAIPYPLKPKINMGKIGKAADVCAFAACSGPPQANSKCALGNIVYMYLDIILISFYFPSVLWCSRFT